MNPTLYYLTKIDGKFKRTRLTLKMLERNIEQSVVRWATERNIPHLKLNVQGRRGYLDHLFFILGGRPALIEFKRKGKKPRPLQLHTISILQELGYDVLWTDSKVEAIEFLERCVKGSGHERRRKGSNLR